MTDIWLSRSCVAMCESIERDGGCVGRFSLRYSTLGGVETGVVCIRTFLVCLGVIGKVIVSYVVLETMLY